MPRSCTKSASKVGPSASAALSDAVEVREPPARESLALSPKLARRLSDFQRDHVQYPPLLPFKCRTVYVPILRRDLSPALRYDGKPLLARVILEIAFQEYTRRPRWERRPRAVWYFLAWDIDGSCLLKTRRRSRAGVQKLYKIASARRHVVPVGKRLVLVTRPESPSTT